MTDHIRVLPSGFEPGDTLLVHHRDVGKLAAHYYLETHHGSDGEYAEVEVIDPEDAGVADGLPDEVVGMLREGASWEEVLEELGPPEDDEERAVWFACDECGREFASDEYDNEKAAQSARAGHGRSHSEEVQAGGEKGLNALFDGEGDSG